MHDGEATERGNTEKILRIHFDENLSWSYHINKIIQFLTQHLEVFVSLNVLQPIKSVNRLLKLWSYQKLEMVSSL